MVLNQISSSCCKQLTTWILDCIWLWSHERTEAAVRCVVDAKTICSLPAVWPLIQLLCMFPCFLGGSTSTSCGWLQPCRAQNLKHRAMIIQIIYNTWQTVLSVHILWVTLNTGCCLHLPYHNVFQNWSVLLQRHNNVFITLLIKFLWYSCLKAE